jgi:hypothetical protein
MEIWETKPPGTLWATPGLLRESFTFTITFLKVRVKVKRKVHPVAGHECPDGEERYSTTLSLTSSLDWVGGQSRAPTAFTPWKEPVPIV